MKLKWTSRCVISTADNHNVVNSDNILFTIKDTKIVPVVILWAKDNQKLSKLLSEKFKKSLYWNKYKTKSKNALWHTSTDNFLNQILSSSIENVSIINPLILIQKHMKCKRKFTKGQGEDYTTGFLVDYDWISNHYRLIADDFSRPKDLDSDPKANQQTEVIEQSKNSDGVNADGN